jgi:hypothetical protein
MFTLYIYFIYKARYTNDFKNRVINFAGTHTIDETLEKYNLDRRRLKDWQNNKVKIQSMKYKRNTFRVKPKDA